MNRKSDTPGNFGCPKGVQKSELFSQETYIPLSKSRIWNLEISSFEKTKCVPLTSFLVKDTNDYGYIFAIFTH